MAPRGTDFDLVDLSSILHGESFSLTLIFGLLGVYWIRVGRINARSVLMGACWCWPFYVTVAVVLNKGGTPPLAL